VLGEGRCGRLETGLHQASEGEEGREQGQIQREGPGTSSHTRDRTPVIASRISRHPLLENKPRPRQPHLQPASVFRALLRRDRPLRRLRRILHVKSLFRPPKRPNVRARTTNIMPVTCTNTCYATTTTALEGRARQWC
jgi:hypothetical protein